MGVLNALVMMAAILVLTWLVSRWDASTAYRLLEHSQHLFEPESGEASVNEFTLQPQAAPARVRNERAGRPAKRPYISPLVKKRIAAKQGWRCAVCRELLDETYEIDHIKALWRGGSNDMSNLQALCKRDHVWKSAVLDQRS